jgi:type II secretory pathway pseudopilin PulG
VNIRKSEGFALIDLLFVCGLIGVLSIIALPRLLLAKQAAGAASAIGSLRAVTSAQLTFALTCGAGFYAPSLPALGRVPVGSTEAFISANLATGDVVTRSGYTIQLQGTAFDGAPTSCNGLDAGEAAQAFKAAADPTEPSNKRYFGVNSNAQIFEYTSSLWAAMPEVGDPPIGSVLQ